MALTLSNQAVTILHAGVDQGMFKMEAGLYSICKHLFLSDAISKEE